uniref:Uncharacterized protein n=1 Tax=Glossina brevipalpis TaxID=37001 RepID=A0A1A9WBS2_9MUSC
MNSSANAAPEFEDGDDLALKLADTFANMYESSLVFDLKDSCILLLRQRLKLYMLRYCLQFLNVSTSNTLQCGGNLFDAVSLAAKAAL